MQIVNLFLNLSCQPGIHLKHSILKTLRRRKARLNLRLSASLLNLIGQHLQNQPKIFWHKIFTTTEVLMITLLSAEILLNSQSLDHLSNLSLTWEYVNPKLFLPFLKQSQDYPLKITLTDSSAAILVDNLSTSINRHVLCLFVTMNSRKISQTSVFL